MTEAEMMQDLSAADAAGDTELAQHIAGKIKAARVPAQEPVGKLEAAARGATQGLTMGWGDEAEARWKSLFPKSMGGGDYKQIRDQLRAQEANARGQHPYIYGGSEALGSVLPLAAGTALTGGAAAPVLARTALPLAAGQGALQGAGSSNADTARGLAGDTALGGGLGALGYGLGQTLGSAGRGLVRWARGKATLATARAAEKAAQEVAEGVASKTGTYGGLRQTENKAILNLLAREQSGLLDAGNQAELESLKQSGRVSQALNESAKNDLEFLSSRTPEVANAKAEMEAAKQGASDAFQARKAELLSPSEMKQQILARALRYGPVAAGSLVGHAIGGPIGGTVGALAGAGSRPMVQSVLRMSRNPAVQKALAEKLIGAVDSPAARLLKLGLTRGLPAAATQELVTQ